MGGEEENSENLYDYDEVVIRLRRLTSFGVPNL